NIPPVVQSIVLANSATAVAGPNTALAFTVTYSEPVFDVGALDFEVVTGPGVTGTPSVSQVIGISNSYKVTLNRNGATGNHGVSGNATIGLKVKPNGSARDGLGNKVVSDTVASSQTYSYSLDTTGPTYGVAYSRVSPVNAGAVTLTLTSNEALSAPPRVSINQPGSTGVTDAETQSVGASSSTFTYSYTVSPNDGSLYVDGNATVSVKGNDIAGNEGTVVTAGATFAIDTTSPNVTLAYSPNRPVKEGTAVLVTGSFSEDMSIRPQLAISGSNTLAATNMQGTGGATWTYSHTVGAGDGEATIAVTGTDLAGNNVAGFINPTFTVDNTAPVAALDYSLDAVNFTGPSPVPGTVRDGNVVTIRATFTEADQLDTAPTITFTQDGNVTVPPP
ncbi:MAG: hypothetical protein EBT09_14000, partial [Actinobacteria bacterium]|nr:hypothetical protein [Actinomycetota bacterium]